MPYTRNQFKILKEILPEETRRVESSLSTTTSASTESISSKSNESEPKPAAACIDPSKSTTELKSPLEELKDFTFEDQLPPKKRVKRVKTTPPVITPRLKATPTDLKAAYKDPSDSREVDHEVAHPRFPTFKDLHHIAPGIVSGLEEGYSRNFSCGPSGYRLKLASEILKEVQDIDFERAVLLDKLADLEWDKRSKLTSLHSILETQLEEHKCNTLNTFEQHYLSTPEEELPPTKTTDKFGIEVQAGEPVEVYNPFTDLIEEGTVKQVLPNNVALVHLSKTEQVVGLFGDNLVSKDT